MVIMAQAIMRKPKSGMRPAAEEVMASLAREKKSPYARYFGRRQKLFGIGVRIGSEGRRLTRAHVKWAEVVGQAIGEAYKIADNYLQNGAKWNASEGTQGKIQTRGLRRVSGYVDAGTRREEADKIVSEIIAGARNAKALADKEEESFAKAEQELPYSSHNMVLGSALGFLGNLWAKDIISKAMFEKAEHDLRAIFRKKASK
jgi:hypothetical protein